MDIDKVVNKNRECQFDHNNTQQPPPPPKKQVRRRLHSNKPYQERLMNMAEARREIATALKFHRASMKQQHTTTSNHDFQTHQQSSTSTTNYLGTYSFPHHWPTSTSVPPPPPLPLMNHDNLDLVLPNQTLGLNLNFQDFNNLSTKIYHTPMSVCSSSSSPTTSSSILKEVALGGGGSAMHHAIKNEEIMENETIKERKVANSHIDDDDNDDSEGNYHHPFEQVMEFPPWLINTNESSCFQDLFDHHLSHQYSPDPALPCMDIGEIEGMDGEWLA